MLDQYHLEQYDRIYTWSAVILTVQIFYKFIYLAEIYRCIYLPKKMILGY